MSVLSLSELPASERSNVVAMRRQSEIANDAAMRKAIKSRWDSLNLPPLALRDALSAAEAERAFGGSTAQGYRAGVSKLERTAAQQKAIRTRFGTRPDDNGPRAA